MLFWISALGLPLRVTRGVRVMAGGREMAEKFNIKVNCGRPAKDTQNHVN
jgi:hypothetical protein